MELFSEWTDLRKETWKNIGKRNESHRIWEMTRERKTEWEMTRKELKKEAWKLNRKQEKSQKKEKF